LDTELILALAQAGKKVVTVEENVVQGGFGSAVLELLAAAKVKAEVLCLGLPDAFIEQGSQAELRSEYGLDAQGIAASVRTFLSR
jgi:1-deoxy-D-xylulose-5-phosphate synthase